MKKYSFLRTLIVLVLPLFAQVEGWTQTTIQGIIQDDQGTPLEFANALLLNAADSSLVRGAVTNQDGRYVFEKVLEGSYLLSGSAVGFAQMYQGPFPISNEEGYQLNPLTLSTGVDLAEVKVTAEKPLYVQEIDRMVVNVANSIMSAGSNALEILERSPGVIVNRQNNSISVVGKQGVVIMINGKINYMPVAGLIQYLEGMSADNIERIELITTPPAKYDAEGNAGFINIVMKKKTDEGVNGSYSLSYGYGRGHVSNNNLNVNFRQGNISLFGNYGFVLDARDQFFGFDRFVTTNGVTEFSGTGSDRVPTQRNHNLRLGLDYQITEKTVIGILGTLYDNKWSMDAFNTNILRTNEAFTGLITLDNTERNQWQHASANFNIKHNFTEDASISWDVDYLHYYNENPTNYTNEYFGADNSFTREELTRSDKTTPIHFYVSNLDYAKKFSDKFKLEAGIKGTFSTFDNDVRVETREAVDWVADGSLTNISELNEKILAGYTSMEYQISDKTGAKFGLRYEYTDSKLDSDVGGRVVDRQFGRLFPTLFLSHNFSDDFSGNVSYSRRITRPTFNDMAPWVIFVDPTTFYAGNTSLQPAISDGVKMDLRYKTIFLSFQYTVEDSTIANFQQRYDPDADRLIWLAENLKNTKTFSATLGFPLTITKWWTMRNNVNFFVQESNYYANRQLLSLSNTFFQFNTNQSFKLPWGLNSEVSFFYVGKQLFGAMEIDPIYGLTFGVQRNLGERLGSLRFNIRDALNSIEWMGNLVVEDQGLISNSRFDFSQRTFVLTYNRSFGNSKLKQGRNRRTGAEEERRRVN